MKNNEKVSDYIAKVIVITNEMKSYGETLFKQVIIEKVQRSLAPQLYYIVVAIKHFKDTNTMRIEELRSCLEAQQLHLIERNSKKRVRTSSKRSDSEGFLWKEEPKVSMAREQEKVRKVEETNIARGDSDGEPVLLMASENVGGSMVDWWYMDTGCSNHLSGNKQWLVNFDSCKRTKIRCDDDKYLNAKGMGKFRVKLTNGKIVLIKDVLYELGRNRTFKVNVATPDTQCLNARSAEEESELWHKRLGHMNYKILGHLSSKNLVHGILRLWHQRNHVAWDCMYDGFTKDEGPWL
ncbi:uncharacterized protein LOC127082551 [Lathyrus oleraceus]|uniref:uncharacterized protein LOC127082551 n=1 Tax=Pisum sativum TaxID=3888 RepID=UPI0021D187E1|nr:uncharacterized protein LOC127082551 [Pisum sativum]